MKKFLSIILVGLASPLFLEASVAGLLRRISCPAGRVNQALQKRSCHNHGNSQNNEDGLQMLSALSNKWGKILQAYVKRIPLSDFKTNDELVAYCKDADEVLDIRVGLWSFCNRGNLDMPCYKEFLKGYREARGMKESSSKE